jgi:hypothetical protein
MTRYLPNTLEPSTVAARRKMSEFAQNASCSQRSARNDQL